MDIVLSLTAKRLAKVRLFSNRWYSTAKVSSVLISTVIFIKVLKRLRHCIFVLINWRFRQTVVSLLIFGHHHLWFCEVIKVIGVLLLIMKLLWVIRIFWIGGYITDINITLERVWGWGELIFLIATWICNRWTLWISIVMNSDWVDFIIKSAVAFIYYTS